MRRDHKTLGGWLQAVHDSHMRPLHRPCILIAVIPGLLLAGCLSPEGNPFSDEGIAAKTPTGGEGNPDSETDPSTGLTFALPAPLGATPNAGGVSFVVWAKSAKSVSVQGDFTAAPLSMTKLTSPVDGYFSLQVAAARPGQRYRYRITAADGTVLSRIDPYGRQVLDGQSVIVDPAAYSFTSAPHVRPGKNNLVVYELHVGSFNCPTDPARCGFTSLRDRLDHVSSLGVNVIEMMPMNSHGSTRGWGYNPHSYFAPHAPYGKPDELRSLVDKSHALGISVVMDMVYNHYDGWKGAPLYCFDGSCDGYSGVYFFSDPKYKNTPWGPRFDYTQKPVADFIVDNVTYWRREYRMDGFRWDSVSNIRALDGSGSVPGGVALLQRANGESKRTAGALLIAEDLKGYGAVTDRIESGGMGFDSQWDGGFHWAVTQAVTGYDDFARNIYAVRDALGVRYNGDPFQRIIYTESHDTVGNSGTRLPSQIDPADPGSWAARKRSILAAGILLTAPGIPMLFAGQEFLSIGRFVDPPAPLDWSRAMGHSRIVDFYRDMIALRRNANGKTAGLTGSDINVFHLNDPAKVLVYHRSDGKNDVVVLVNFANKNYTRYDIGLPAFGTWKVRMNSDDRKYSTDFGGAPSTDVIATSTARDGFPFMGSVALGPYSIVVLSRD